MRGIGNEPLLRVERRLQSVQSPIDGGDEGMHVARQPAFRQSHGCRARPNRRGLVRRHAQWREPDARHQQIDGQQDDDERDPDPGDVLHEFLQHAVVDDIAGMEGDLHPYGLVAVGRSDRQAIKRRLLVGRLQNEEILGRGRH